MTKRPREKSLHILARGRGPLLQTIKDNSKGIVKIETDDAEIGYGYLMDESPTRVKVGYCVNINFNIWEIASIQPNRIRRFSRLSGGTPVVA
jgi:hypothetical protein